MKPLLEHVNLTVRDSARTAEKLCAIFGWEIRWRGPTILDGYAHHVGTEDRYLALYSPKQSDDGSKGGFDRIGRLNHVGVVVDDLDEIERRVIAAGYEPRSHQDYEPGRRFYFYDEDDIEYEVVSYA